MCKPSEVVRFVAHGAALWGHWGPAADVGAGPTPPDWEEVLKRDEKSPERALSVPVFYRRRGAVDS